MVGDAPRLLKATALAVFLVSAAHLVWLVCDYSRCFQENEVYANWLGRIVLEGRSFSWSDLKTVFDVWSMDGGSRPRFLSYLFAIWTAKARLALWDVLPPHPSFSPIWAFSLLLGPWLLYRFLKGELECRWSALLGTGLYMATAGYLSSAAMLFHPGKPLANVVVIGTLYAAMKANRRAKSFPPDETPRFSAPMTLFLAGVFPVLLFTDETALFALAILPVWSHRFFIPRRWNGPNLRACFWNIADYAVAPIGYLLITFGFAPWLVHRLMGQPFDFGLILTRYQDPGKFDMGHILQHLTTLLAGGLAPWSALKADMPIADALVWRPGSLLGCLAILSGLGLMAFAGRLYRKSSARIAALMLVFWALQSFAAAHHPLTLVVSGYYYGAIFSVLLAVLFAGALGGILRKSRIRWLAVGMAGYLLAIQIHNFNRLNRSWMAHSYYKTLGWLVQFAYNPYLAHGDMTEILKRYQVPPRSLYAEDIPVALRRHPRTSALELWKKKGHLSPNGPNARPLSLADMWLLTELYYMRTPGDLRDGKSPALVRPEDRGLLLYRGALARAHMGLFDEEPLPVLAFCRVPRGEIDPHGFNVKLAYPWIWPNAMEGVKRCREVGYTHWLVPVSDGWRGDGAYWAFHNEIMKAMEERRLYELGLIVVGQTNIAGRELAVIDMRSP